MAERIEKDGILYALIVRKSAPSKSTTFYTSHQEPMQLAQFGYDRGKVFPPHEHKRIPRQIDATSEVLLIRRGQLKADIYDVERKLIGSWVLEEGDLILILAGGHGFEVLTDGFEMIEIKQGPYLGMDDKTRFGDELCPSERTSSEWQREEVRS